MNMSCATFAFCVAFSVFTVSCLASPVQTRRGIATDAGPDLKKLNNNSVRKASASLDASIDVLGIANAIGGAVSMNQNRDAFVKNLVYTAFYKAGSKYNVMVFNLNVDHEEQLKGVKLYASANYDGIIFGIWVFESGSFTNKGDGGYINWAFRGMFDRDGGHVSFH